MASTSKAGNRIFPRPTAQKEAINLFAGSKSYEKIETQLKYELVHNAEHFMAKSQDFTSHYSEKHKVGFFSLDRSSQTELSDVVDVKEMAVVTSHLLKDIKAIKKDIIIAKQMMMTDYKSTIKQKSVELYTRVNSRVVELETMHTDRVAVIRRAYKQQLNDALISIHSLYQKKLENQMRRIHKMMKAESGAGDINEMKSTIARSESVISMLQLQLEAARVQTCQPPTIQEETVSESDEDIGRLQIEMNDMKEEHIYMDNKIKLLEEELTIKESNLLETKNQLGKSRDASTKLKETMDQLKNDYNALMSSNHKNDSAKLFQAEKNALEFEMNKKLKEKDDYIQTLMTQTMIKEVELGKSSEEFKETIMDGEFHIQMANEKIADLEKQVATLKGKEKIKLDNKEDFSDAEKLRAEIERLKKELERVHKVWEKKFSVLQLSLHALKDESYVRHSLERQSARLHRSQVDFKMGGNKQIRPNVPKPLPKIQQSIEMSAARFTPVINTDENQIMESNETLPANITCLPQPSSGRRSQEEPMSRASSVINLVV